jgi:hypothetical protein
MELYYGNYYEQIYVNFAGPAFLYQYTFNSKKSFKLSSVVSLGVTTYRNEGRKVINYYLLTGNNFGADVSFDSEYFITRNLSVDFGISELFSSIRKVEFSNGLRTSEIKLEKDKYKNLSRLDLSVGIRFYLLDK